MVDLTGQAARSGLTVRPSFVGSEDPALHPFDQAVLEQAIARTTPADPDHHEAVARLSLARRA